ncbi:mitochondrial mRNA pseudouridine synthase Rpusd3-like [Periplaneta americana]|uniref:mitochondrial mRNA pseudouridine synthase Rpusd3-like n=1 Tax=Periplaneta americana TaxID=6978 RepID=UPI0037E7AF84
MIRSIVKLTSKTHRKFMCGCCSNFVGSNKIIHHEYSKVNPWNSLKEFSDFLMKNIIYNKDDIVVLNKPYGVGLSPPSTTPQRKTNTVITNTAHSGQRDYYLNMALPHIAEKLGYETLTVLKIPERYTSGVTVLSPCDKVIDKVRKCMKKASGRHQLFAHYWAVVIGNPQPNSAVLKMGITLKKNPNNNKDKQPVVLKEWSKNSVKCQEVKVFRVEHHTLCQQHLASLVEIRPSGTKWHFLRVYLAHMQSPILGDNLYGSRVQTIMGVPVTINPCSDAAKSPKKLPDNLKASLSLQPGQEVIIPTHLHLRRLILPHYLGHGDLILEAPVPSSFQWTCECLGLYQSGLGEERTFIENFNR